MPGAALATALYVALNGSDSNTGTSRAAAFATLRKCVAAAPAGGTCVLGGGRYDRAKDWPSGAIEITRDITIVGDPQSAKRAVLDGSVAIETQWTAGTGDEKCVYTSSPMDVVPWQLWATGSAPSSGVARRHALPENRFECSKGSSCSYGHFENGNSKNLSSTRTGFRGGCTPPMGTGG